MPTTGEADQQQRTLADDPDALQHMLQLLRRADLHRLRQINSAWRDSVHAVLRSEEWQRAHRHLVVARSPTQELALQGTVLLNPQDALFRPGEEVVHLQLSAVTLVDLDEPRWVVLPGTKRIISASANDAVAPGTVAMNVLHRKSLRMECGTTLLPQLVPVDAPVLARVALEVRLQVETSKGPTRFSRPRLERAVRAAFGGQALWPGLELALPAVGRALPWHALPDRLERAVLVMTVLGDGFGGGGGGGGGGLAGPEGGEAEGGEAAADGQEDEAGRHGAAAAAAWGVLGESSALEMREPAQRSFLELVAAEEGFAPSGSYRGIGPATIGGGCCG